VLRLTAGNYRLHYNEVNEDEAREVLVNFGRPVVARFALNGTDWENISAFFRVNRTGILPAGQLTLEEECRCKEKCNCGGHACGSVGSVFKE